MEHTTFFLCVYWPCFFTSFFLFLSLPIPLPPFIILILWPGIFCQLTAPLLFFNILNSLPTQTILFPIPANTGYIHNLFFCCTTNTQHPQHTTTTLSDILLLYLYPSPTFPSWTISPTFMILPPFFAIPVELPRCGHVQPPLSCLRSFPVPSSLRCLPLLS